MCGIVGLCLREGVVRREQILAMNATLVHRGPDGEGVFIDGVVGLGMRRLAIIDLANGHQPISNETGQIQVIQNGEIYNFQELRKELESLRHTFSTDSDTEVIVHAFEEWGGLGFAAHLRGMFAIAIWDSVEKKLWLARDRIGIKPLYYSETSDGIAFGSEVKALLASPIVNGAFDPKSLSQYFAFGNSGTVGSLVQNVSQLAPGSVLCFDGKRSTICSYWELRFPDRPCCTDEREATILLRERLEETVRAHMISDVPVVAFLSGGVDSSAIVGLMMRGGASNIKTFSIGFGNPAFNELPHARQVASYWKTDHHTEIVQPDDAISIIDQLLDHLDEPFADASAIPMWYLSRLAAREVKVVLSGDGGDELFAGYSRYSESRRDAWLDQIPVGARRLVARMNEHLPHRFPGKNFFDYAAMDRRGRYISELTLFSEPLRRRLIRPEWQPEGILLEDPIQAPLRLMQQVGVANPLSECMYLDIKQYLPCDILVKVDRMTMAHSLEARPPLLDHEFLEFALSLPMSLKYTEDGRQKHILKEAVKPIVPQDVLDRKKMGFAVPLGSWFANPLAPVLQDCVLRNSLCSEYLDTRVVSMLFEENRRGRRDHGLKLWAILVFEMWLRRLRSAGR